MSHLTAVINYASVNREHAAYELARRLQAAGFNARANYAGGSKEHVTITPFATRGFTVHSWEEAEAMAAAVERRPTLKVKQLPHGADLALPAYETAGAAGMDLRAALPMTMRREWLGEKGVYVLFAGLFGLIPTGLSMAIPEGFEVQVRPRSGLAAKHGISIVNSPGTVDCDYRGEVKVCLINHGTEPFVIRHGDRIAQMVVAPVMQAQWQVVDTLDETTRGTGGYGSTGQN